MHKEGQKNSASKSRHPTLSQSMRVVKWKNRTQKEKAIDEKEKKHDRIKFWAGLKRIYILTAERRIKELEAVLHDPDLINALSAFKLRFTSNDQNEDVKRIEALRKKIISIKGAK